MTRRRLEALFLPIVSVLFIFVATNSFTSAEKEFSGVYRQNGSTFYMSKDWPEEKFRITDFVSFTIRVPQFKRKHRTFKIIIGLFANKVPKTVGNFAQLAAGGILPVDKSSKNSTKKRRVLKYAGTPLHRLEKDVSIQGGDVVNKDGTGTVTRYDDHQMAPENYFLANYGKGWVGMVHNGHGYDYSIGCQFYICMTNSRPILYALNLQRFVVIGKVVKGFKHLQRLNDAIGEAIELDETLVPETGYPLNRPKVDIKIIKSGYMHVPKSKQASYKTSNRPAIGSLYGQWPKPPKKKPAPKKSDEKKSSKKKAGSPEAKKDQRNDFDE